MFMKLALRIGLPKTLRIKSEKRKNLLVNFVNLTLLTKQTIFLQDFLLGAKSKAKSRNNTNLRECVLLFGALLISLSF
jgi:hypothetical protein